STVKKPKTPGTVSWSRPARRSACCRLSGGRATVRLPGSQLSPLTAGAARAGRRVEHALEQLPATAAAERRIGLVQSFPAGRAFVPQLFQAHGVGQLGGEDAGGHRN